MKIINKIILGLILLSGSLMADEVKLAWKGCESKVMYALYGLNVLPEVKYNAIQKKILTNSISATRKKPFIVDKEIYDEAKKLYYSDINPAINKGELFTTYINDIGLLDRELENQNTIIDGMAVTIFMINCMEVVE